ncbi:MAG: hypothetical protein ACLTYN_11645 [Dysosmobacter welbionis]
MDIATVWLDRALLASCKKQDLSPRYKRLRRHTWCAQAEQARSIISVLTAMLLAATAWQRTSPPAPAAPRVLPCGCGPSPSSASVVTTLDKSVAVAING